jgi:TonB family protein
MTEIAAFPFVSPAPVPVLQQRRAPRYRAKVPVEITVLRSGVPHELPGRTVDVGPGGVGAVVAGMLIPGESVGIAFRLPSTDQEVLARARVRYQDRVHCGLEFIAPNRQPVETIQRWASEVRPAAISRNIPTKDLPTARFPEVRISSVVDDTRAPAAGPPPRRPAIRWHRRRRTLHRTMWLLGMMSLATALFGWLYWRLAWNELEQTLAATRTSDVVERLSVPPEVMMKQATHRVLPDYPADARNAGIQGVVVLQAVIGRDGRVLAVRPLSGPSQLWDAAQDAVRWWQFQPYEMNGKKVEVETLIALEFRPPQRS